MSLIIIRRLFKDLSNLRLTGDWFNIKYDLQFSYDLATSLLMFFLIYLFYLQSEPKKKCSRCECYKQFVINEFY